MAAEDAHTPKPPLRHTLKVYRIRGRPGQNDRPPMPAGHPVSWGLLVNGTALHGAIYPHPVFQ